MGKLDLLIVKDNKNDIQKWIIEVVKEFGKLQPNQSVKATSIFDPDNEKKDMQCKKVVLFTATQEFSVIDSLVKGWLDGLGIGVASKDYLIINLNDHREAEQPESENTFKGNIIEVKSLDNFATWWPRLIRFMYGQQSVKPRSCYVKNLSEGYSETNKGLQMLKKALSFEGIGINDRPNTDVACAVILAESSSHEIEPELKDEIRELKSVGKMVHMITFKGDTVSEDVRWVANCTHDRSRPLRQMLWMLKDLRIAKFQLPERITYPMPPPPYPPYSWATIGADVVILGWLEYFDAHPPIKCFTIEAREVSGCRSPTTSETWIVVATKESDGVMPMHRLSLSGLDRSKTYQFRISSENEDGRSKGILTAHLSPSSMIDVDDNCPVSWHYGACGGDNSFLHTVENVLLCRCLCNCCPGAACHVGLCTTTSDE